MKVELLRDDRSLTLDVNSADGIHSVEMSDGDFRGEVRRIGGNLFEITTGDGPVRAWAIRDAAGRIDVEIAGESYRFQVAPKGRKKRSADGDVSGEKVAEIRPPMPGRVVKIKVTEGEEVAADQVVAIVEAMKIEVNLTSPIAGIVTKITAGDGDQIDTAQPLVVVEVEEKEKKE